MDTYEDATRKLGKEIAKGSEGVWFNIFGLKSLYRTLTSTFHYYTAIWTFSA